MMVAVNLNVPVDRASLTLKQVARVPTKRNAVPVPLDTRWKLRPTRAKKINDNVNVLEVHQIPMVVMVTPLRNVANVMLVGQ